MTTIPINPLTPWFKIIFIALWWRADVSCLQKFSITSESQAPKDSNSWKNLYFSAEALKLKSNYSSGNSSSVSKCYKQYNYHFQPSLLIHNNWAVKNKHAYQFLHHKEVLPVRRDPLIEVSLLLCSPAVTAWEEIKQQITLFSQKKKKKCRE